MHRQCPQGLQTQALSEQVAAIRSACSDADTAPNGAAEALLDAWLLPICAVSPYIARTLSQFPDILPRLLQSGGLLGASAANVSDEDAPSSKSDDLTQRCDELRIQLERDYQKAHEVLKATDANAIEALQQQSLRQFRHRHMVRILWRDLTRVSTLEQMLKELSLLAQCCIMAADQWSYDALVARYGIPCDQDGCEQRLIVIGMGKLGGYELNVSSDIDLIYLFGSSGTTVVDGERQKPLDNADFFRRSAQRIGKLLNNVTAEGFVYRVDTRLRPFGESGPLVMNLDGLENYYLTQARDWERYAMIKGRALCGNSHDIKALEELVQPFVYRRYLDYNAFESLRDLKRKIALSLLQKAMVDNIKLGPGGIREIEFIGQAFQLVRGGQESRLRIRPIMQVLRRLVHLQLMSAQEVDGLLDAYHYLRIVENAVQMMRDEQVHCLPEDALDRQRLLCIVDETDWTVFKDELAVHQACVSRCFTALFESSENESNSGDIKDTAELDAARDIWAALCAEAVSDHDKQAMLASLGYESDESLLVIINSLTAGSFYQRLAAESQQRVERVVPLILNLAKDTKAPGATLGRMLALVKAVAGRSGYLQVLCDQPDALKHLVSLFSRSRWLAKFVAGQPMVIDELLTNAALHIDAQGVFTETQELVERLRNSELDVQMDSMRHYRQAREMRIACAQLDGSLTLMQVSDQLSWLAEAIIAGVISLVSMPLDERFGRPGYSEDDVRKPSHVGVLAYGKLGGLELGFSSDLDLVFVHDSTGTKQQTDGEKPVDNGLYYAKLAQKFVHFMGTNTPAGMLYEIDLRLRPNGSSGVLVTGIGTFADYQQSNAWTWEHQALMRARLVYGIDSLRVRFDEIRQHVLARQRPVDELRKEVAAMRERMRSALGNTQSGQMHLKQDTGGVADIEFIVQYLVLAYSREHPTLLSFTDNIRVLETVEALHLIPTADASALRTSYLGLRMRLHRRALDEASAIVPLDAELEALRGVVTGIRERILG